MRTSSAVLAGMILLAGFGAARAQQPYPSSGYPNSQPPASGYDRGTGVRPGGSSADQDDAEPAPDLMRDLNLRPGQAAALADYKGAFQSDPQREARDQADEARLPSMTTLERLDYAARQMDADRQDFERSSAATRRFYAQLSPEQKRTFDRLTAPQPEQDEDDGGPPSQPQPRSAPR